MYDRHYLLLSISHEKFTDLKKTWIEFYKDPKTNRRLGTDRSKLTQCGGKLLLLDWASKQLVISRNVPFATGMYWNRSEIYLCSYNALHKFDNHLNQIESFSHPLFCDLHSVSALPDGFLLTSSGIDTILKISVSFEVSIAWSATQSGFSTTPTGQTRVLDLSLDHRCNDYNTLSRTTHLNGCLWIPEENAIYVTLFHQGVVVSVHTDGTIREILAGLQAPHAIRRREDDLLYCADSKANRIVVWRLGCSPQFLSLDGCCDWIQDVYWDAVLGVFFVVDCNNRRVLTVTDKGQITDAFQLAEDWRIHEVKPFTLPGARKVEVNQSQTPSSIGYGARK
jgi:hypothetical protein